MVREARDVQRGAVLRWSGMTLHVSAVSAEGEFRWVHTYEGVRLVFRVDSPVNVVTVGPG